MIILESWFGRLGNNIVQLNNAIHIALYYKHNIVFKEEHELFNLKLISDYFSKYKNEEIISGKFYYRNQTNYPHYIYNKNNEEKIKLLKDAFLIKNVNKLDENDLVVHIRSGDIFNTCINNDYIPPPLSYYIEEINKVKYKKLIILSENKENPIVDKLLNIYKNAIYNENSLKEDIKIILGTSQIIYSVGSFIPSLLKISNNIKYSVGFNLPKNLDYSMFKHPWLHSDKNEEYFKKLYPWKCTKEQIDFMLSFKLNSKL